ncbi:MAG: hypothetical protein JNL57_00045 [Bacteroidetes bacterium]|nr:hypothetical protein [Bacteroidota bacterium]
MNRIVLILLMVSTHFSVYADTAKTIPGTDSMDKLFNQLSAKSDSLKQKIEAAKQKIEDAQAENSRKPNLYIPILAGAAVGIAVAWWLRSRKKAGK